EAFHTERPVMTLGEIAAATGFYKSTILRLAASLERFGYLVREESGAFRLGPALWRVGAIYRGGVDLGQAVRPEVRRLAETTGETASFYIREGRSRVCLFRHNSLQSARHHLEEGALLPLDAGASAHVLAAFSDGKGPKAKAVRQRGYCVSLGERDPQLAAVAVPPFALPRTLRGSPVVFRLVCRFPAPARRAA